MFVLGGRDVQKAKIHRFIQDCSYEVAQGATSLDATNLSAAPNCWSHVVAIGTAGD